MFHSEAGEAGVTELTAFTVSECVAAAAQCR